MILTTILVYRLSCIVQKTHGKMIKIDNMGKSLLPDNSVFVYRYQSQVLIPFV